MFLLLLVAFFHTYQSLLTSHTNWHTVQCPFIISLAFPYLQPSTFNPLIAVYLCLILVQRRANVYSNVFYRRLLREKWLQSPRRNVLGLKHFIWIRVNKTCAK